jgi:hypothetical protein
MEFAMPHRATHRVRPPVRKAPLLVLTFFLVLWLIGVATGEPQRVLEQAWQVCLSCIGIG